MNHPAIVVENLSKSYRLGRRSPGQRLRGFGAAPRDTDLLWALRDVNLKVDAGEVVGIIGPNGAGKSTLLKILSRVVTPTAGRATIHGRIGSLLEVGTGFHPELTGRENIFLNGAILGLSRAEIRRRFDAILAFSEMERFLDTPVKRYSSGMYVRLAFAVAAHLEPEILIVDEVLAVGDVQFQRKCLGQMDAAARGGRTILFVSHNMAAIRALCTRAVLLRDGSVVREGPADDVVRDYLAAGAAQAGHDGLVTWTSSEAPGGTQVRLRGVRVWNSGGVTRASFDVNEPIFVAIDYDVCVPVTGLRVVLSLGTPDGTVAFASTDHDQQPAGLTPGEHRSVCRIPGGLLNVGEYVVAVAVGIPGRKALIPSREVLRLTIQGLGNHGSRFVETWPGAVCPRLEWWVESRGSGCAAARGGQAEAAMAEAER